MEIKEVKSVNKRKIAFLCWGILIISGCMVRIDPDSRTTGILPATASPTAPSPETTPLIMPDISSTTTDFSSEPPAEEPVIVDNLQEEPKLYTYEEIAKMLPPDRKLQLIEQEKERFEKALETLNNEYSFYNLIMAKWNENIAYSYYVSDVSPGYKIFFKDKYPIAINYLEQETSTYPIFFGHSSKDFVTFFCISQPLGEVSQECQEALSRIRGLENELEFLKGLASLTEKHGYFALDIYVEDGLQANRILPYSGIKLYWKGDGMRVDDRERINSIHEPIDDPELDAYLKKYGREINYIKELKDREWNLILFPKQTEPPLLFYLYLDSYGPQGILFGR